MIRLGSLAGYPFEGPRALAGWTAPTMAAVWAVMYKPSETKQDFAVIYVDHSEDLSKQGFPFRHIAFPCWAKRAGNKFNLYVCTYEVPGGLKSHREQISRELISIYKPSCNTDQYDQSWRSEWIGEYQAPTTGPLTTDRDPNQ